MNKVKLKQYWAKYTQAADVYQNLQHWSKIHSATESYKTMMNSSI